VSTDPIDEGILRLHLRVLPSSAVRVGQARLPRIVPGNRSTREGRHVCARRRHVDRGTRLHGIWCALTFAGVLM